MKTVLRLASGVTVEVSNSCELQPCFNFYFPDGKSILCVKRFSFGINSFITMNLFKIQFFLTKRVPSFTITAQEYNSIMNAYEDVHIHIDLTEAIY